METPGWKGSPDYEPLGPKKLLFAVVPGTPEVVVPMGVARSLKSAFGDYVR
jgi:hypothetical protein